MTSQQIADAINANCEAYHARKIDHATWSAEQFRLWNQVRSERHRVLVMQALGFLPSTVNPRTIGCPEVEAVVARALDA